MNTLTPETDEWIKNAGLYEAIEYAIWHMRNLELQRDRLAEALQKLADCDWVITLPDRMDAVREIANEALQSLDKPTEQ